MKKLLIGQYRHFGLFFMICLRHYILFYLFIALGLILLLSGISILYSLANPQSIQPQITGMFWTLMNIGGIIITTSAFSIYGSKAKRMNLLTLPVSAITRFTSVFLLTLPLFLIFMVLVYTLAANTIAWALTSMDIVKHFTFNPFMDDTSIYGSIYNHLKFYIGFQSIMLLFGSFFPKLGFIKSAITFAGLFLLLMIINSVSSFYPLDHSFILNFFTIIGNNQYQFFEVRKMIPITIFIWQCICFLIVPLTLYIVFIRIREIEA